MPQPSADDRTAQALGRTPDAAAARAGPAARAGGRLLLPAAVLALVAASFAYVSWRDFQSTLDSGWQTAERGALGAAEHARRTLAVARLVTRSVALGIRREGLARVRGDGWDDLAGLAAQTPEVTALWVTDEAGRVVAASIGRVAPVADWSVRPFFAPLRDGAAEAFLMPLTWGVITRNWYLSYSLAVRDGAGRFLGIVQSALFTPELSRAYAELDLPDGTRAGVLRAADGAPLILWPPPPPADRSVAAQAPGEAAALLRAAGPDGGEAQGRLTLDTAQGPAVAAWRRLDAGTGLVAFMILPRAQVLAPFRARLVRGSAMMLLAGAGLGALAWATQRAERRAARSEAQFRGTFEQAAVGVAHVGLDGRWVRANARLCAMLGYDEAELRARTIHDVTHPDDAAATREMARRVLSGEAESVTLRKRYLRRDGGVVWGELTASLLRDAATGRPVHGVAVIQDIGARVAAEAARAASERRLALACAAVGLGVFDVDAATGMAVVNAEWRMLYGLPPGDAPVSLEERLAPVHPEDRDRIRARTLAAYAGGGGYEEEFRIIRRDTGEVRWIASRGAFVEDGGEGGARRFLGLIQDVTARRAAEAARAASEERLAMASVAAGMGVFDVDARSGRAVVNAQWRRVYGLPPGGPEVDFEARMALVLPEDRARVREAVQAAYLAGTPYLVEFRIRRRDTGEIRWLVTRGSYVGEARPPVRFLGVTYDITDRKRAEAARAASDERLAMASRAAGIGVWDVDVATGLAEVNEEYRRLYFLPSGDGALTVEERLAHVHPEDRPRLRDHRVLSVPAGIPFADEFRVVDPGSGEVRWIASSGSGVGVGAARRVVGVSFDITERRREQERQMLLAREVDHRARNVLAVVRSIVKLSRADDPRQFAEAVEGRVAALARAHTLLARDRWTGAELADIAQEELAAYGLGGRVRLEGPRLRLRPDIVQPLSMVLHELATNAAKHGALARPGGRLELAWRLEGAGAGRRLELVWQERDGPALAGPPLRRGFGSMVVEASVRSQMGGEVTLDWSGGGLRATIALPAERSVAEPGPEPELEEGLEEGAAGLDGVGPHGVGPHGVGPGEAGAGGAAGARVLVVEDEPLVALELAVSLEEAGFAVAGPVAGLAEAVALAEAEAGRLDAAVLDANLHGEPSWPVAAILARQGVPVIYVTGYSSLPAEAGAAEGGVAEGGAVLMLSKPLRDGDLVAALRRVLAREAATPG